MTLLKFYIAYLFRFLRYYLRAGTRYDVHSPFVAGFIENILEDRRRFYQFSAIEYLRAELLKSDLRLTIQDHGAGSRAKPGRQRKVKSIAKHAAVSPKSGRLLFRLVHHYKLKRILELGTSLGIGTLYLSGVRSDSTVITIEGCPETAAQAGRNFQILKRQNIRQLTGTFSDRLPEALGQLEKIDLLYLDGDHRREPVLRNFEQCLTRSHPGSIFIIADLYWSAEMVKLWSDLKKHPSVRISIDLFDMGLLFFDEAILEKQHYTLIRARWKPWRLGFFPKIQTGK